MPHAAWISTLTAGSPGLPGFPQALATDDDAGHTGRMALAIGLLVAGIVLIVLGIFVAAAKFLLWIGLIILIIAAVAWLLRSFNRKI